MKTANPVCGFPVFCLSANDILEDKMMNRRLLTVILTLILFLSCTLPTLAEADGTTRIVNLKTEGRLNPVGIDTIQPAFSWQMQSDAIGAAQTAYRITVWCFRHA